MKAKLTTVLCIIILLFNLILGSSYAADDIQIDLKLESGDGSAVNVDGAGIFKDLINGGSNIGSGDRSIFKNVLSQKHNIMSVSSICTDVSWYMFNIGGQIAKTVVGYFLGGSALDYFTVYELVTGEYGFFNADFSKVTSVDTFLTLKEKVENGTANMSELVEYNKLLAEQDDSGLGVVIQSNVMKFYYYLRNLSLGISLIILIYIGIRMALSTVTSDKVKYKKMFISWFTSVFILFFMHFIIILYGYITGAALDFISEIAVKLNINNVEHNIVQRIVNTILERPGGFTGFSSIIVTFIFIYYQVKFFIVYVKRYCEIVFLIVISPLVTITYSIDKVGDNKAQAFSAWLKELSIKYLIQVVHAITYCILLFTAGAIAVTMPIVAAFFLLVLDRMEKMVRNIFAVKDNSFEKVKMPKALRT